MTALDINPSFNKSELGKLLGNGTSKRFSSSVELKIEELEQKLQKLIKPKLHFRTFKIDSINKNMVRLEDGTTFKSLKLAKALENCNEAICFIATIGNGVDDEIVRLMEDNNMSKAYILDAMGSVIVENMVERFQKRIIEGSKLNGKGTTLRFSPGYCDWPVKEQQKLFSLMDPAKIGVELSDSCLMQPRKSISGVFGIFRQDDGMPATPYNPCKDCNKKGCEARRN